MEPDTVERDVEKLSHSLHALPEPQAKTVLVVVSGLPGTGKSSFSRRLTRDLPSVVLESDALRKVLFPSPTYTGRESGRLFDAIHTLIESLLGRGMPVILDATNLEENHRESLRRIADRAGAKTVLVQVHAPSNVVEERMAARSSETHREDSSDADWSVYQDMRGKEQRIRGDYISVDTSGDIEPAVRKVLRQAKQ